MLGTRLLTAIRSNWASLSVLAEVGPQNLSHLLENRRQFESEPVEQVAKAVYRRPAKVAVEPGHNDGARDGPVPSLERPEISRPASSTTQSSEPRSRKAADIVNPRADEPVTETLRSNPRSPRKRARVVASGEPPRQSVERIGASESPQVDALQASASPRTLPSSIPPRAQARRPRAALAVSAMSVPAPESRLKSVSSGDALDHVHGVPSPPTAAEMSSHLIIPAADERSSAPKQSETRARTREPQRSGDKSTHTVLSPKPKKRARLRPAPQSPPSSIRESGMAEADGAEPPLEPVDPAAASRRFEKRPPPTSPWPTPPTRSRNARSNHLAPSVPGVRFPAPPLASASRASNPGEADVVKIRTDRCYGHAASHPLNAFDIVAGGTKMLAMQAR
mgnify:FL=1